MHLGEWLITQRAIRAGKKEGALTDSQIARLDSIGMVWDNRLEMAWNRALAHCEEYVKEHGDQKVPIRKKRLWLFDMDGTIYKEETLFDGALDLLRAVEDRGGQFVFITNNSSKWVIDFTQTLRQESMRE